MSSSSRISNLPHDPRRPDLVREWDAEQSKADAEKSYKGFGGSPAKEARIGIIAFFGLAAIIWKTKAAALFAMFGVASYISQASSISDIQGILHTLMLASTGLFVCYVRPMQERKSVMRDIVNYMKILQDAGEPTPLLQ